MLSLQDRTSVAPKYPLLRWARLFLCMLPAILLVSSIAPPDIDVAESGHYLSGHLSGVHALQPKLAAVRTERPSNDSGVSPPLPSAEPGPVPDQGASSAVAWTINAIVEPQPLCSGWDARAPPHRGMDRAT
jgi:hypothetical protein